MNEHVQESMIDVVKATWYMDRCWEIDGWIDLTRLEYIDFLGFLFFIYLFWGGGGILYMHCAERKSVVILLFRVFWSYFAFCIFFVDVLVESEDEEVKKWRNGETTTKKK